LRVSFFIVASRSDQLRSLTLMATDAEEHHVFLSAASEFFFQYVCCFQTEAYLSLKEKITNFHLPG
jgi:hypothetical protein